MKPYPNPDPMTQSPQQFLDDLAMYRRPGERPRRHRVHSRRRPVPGCPDCARAVRAWEDASRGPSAR